MLRQFALYGFLKNQRYFEPFFVLYLLQLDCSFADIGILIGVREIILSVLEIPSGAMADMYGRRRCMIASFIAYICSFIIFAVAQEYWHCLLAIIPYAIGDAFRTGTHKAMIFSWLEDQGMLASKQKIYGYTRSWSKIGSAVSIPIAVALVLWTDDYRIVFWASLIPYAAGLINFLTYPQVVDGARRSDVSIRAVMRTSIGTMKRSYTFKPLRHLIYESMAFEGVFKAGKDYLQPLLQQIAVIVSFPFAVSLSDTRQGTVIIGAVYVVLHILSAVASRQSYRVSEITGSERAAARSLWCVNILVYALMAVFLWHGFEYLAVLCFVAVHVLQSLWRPLLISRFDSVSDSQEGATILSIESQSRGLACMFLAPLIGLSIDHWQNMWPLAVIALLPAIVIVLFMPTIAGVNSVDDTNAV